MKTALVERALALGFAQCRVAPAKPPRYGRAFRDWLANGNHGTMEWLRRGEEKRLDPTLVLPGVRSVIALATNYFQGAERPVQRGRIARYAWGVDYHDIIQPRLEALDAFLSANGGKQRIYTDTGPVLERDFAAEAGIGWTGKSTMLLNRELGTWFFLSVILTTLEIEPDTPQRNRCGTCTRCIDACPTGAITAPHRLDARKCISYQTIENKGVIPEEMRPLLGDRIYGCDDCLDACPWNRFAESSREIAFTARPATSAADLRDYLTWDDDRFRSEFRGSPIKRIKRRGFLRNVCVALGNIGTPADLPALETAAADPEPLIAEHANWAIEQIRGREYADVRATALSTHLS